jgi:hypothetical protein
MATAHTLAGRAVLDWKGVIVSGLVAGVAFMMLEMLMVWAFMGQSPWGPPRMIAAMALGQGVLPPPATFDFGVFMAAMFIHFALSWLLAAVFAWAFGGLDTGKAVLVGAVFGLVVYFVNFYGFTAIWPWFAQARNWVSILSHIAFGVVLAWTYKAVADGDRRHQHARPDGRY